MLILSASFFVVLFFNVLLGWQIIIFSVLIIFVSTMGINFLKNYYEAFEDRVRNQSLYEAKLQLSLNRLIEPEKFLAEGESEGESEGEAIFIGDFKRNIKMYFKRRFGFDVSDPEIKSFSDSTRYIFKILSYDKENGKPDPTKENKQDIKEMLNEKITDPGIFYVENKSKIVVVHMHPKQQLEAEKLEL